MTDNNNPMAVITTRIYGMACDNQSCDMRNGLVFGLVRCAKCGSKLRNASVHASCLKWEDKPVTCGDCSSYSWEGYCIKNPPDRQVGYPPAIAVCKDFLEK